MLFNSYEFLLGFLPMILILYFSFIKFKMYKLSKLVLVIASIYFYSFNNTRNLVIILCSLSVNYFIYKLIISSQKKHYIILGIAFNILLLGYFKYTNFVIDNVNAFLNTNIRIAKIILPLGISFFTFQQVGFLIDAYKDKHLKYNILDYCVFITFFPQLVAGPIVSHDEIIPQLKNRMCFNFENFCKGLFIFSIGLTKKVMMADFLAEKVNLGFDTLQSLTLAQGWITSFSYTLQLFLDFSGYCDMAIGIGLMFNIDLPFNFLSPYKAASIKEFWNTWHITLGRFLSKYLYIPLGGNRKGKFRTYINLFFVFFISGIWHGAGWLFILWGTLHGMAMVFHKIWTELGLRMNKVVAWFPTINFVNAAWVFFRAKNIKDALKILTSMTSFNTWFEPQKINDFGGIVYILVLIGLWILVLIMDNSKERLEKFSFNNKYAVIAGILFMISVLWINKVSEFIYFNF